MSGVELALLGALSAGYIDSRYDFFADLVRAKQLIGATLSWKLAIRHSQVSMWFVFENWAKRQPNHLFLVYPEPITEASLNSNKPLEDNFVVRSYTYGRTYDIVLKYSNFLSSEYGIKQGDCVAIDFVNKPEMVFLWLALWNLGAFPALINYNLQGKSLLHCVKVAKAKVFIVDDEVKEHGLSIADDLKAQGTSTIVADKDQFESVSTRYSPLEVTKNITEADPACYIYTSGTTGLPKAAHFSWKKAYWGSRLYGNVNHYRNDDVMYSAMPLYHSTAACLGFLAILQKGGTYAIGHKFSTTTFWTQARISHATAIQYVGETCRYLLNAPPSPDERRHKIRAAFGNGMRPDVWMQFKERFNIPLIGEFYGATEFPSATINLQSGVYGVGSCGAYGSLATAIMRKTKWNIVAIDSDTQDIWRDPITGLSRPTVPNEPGEFVFKVDKNNIAEDYQGYANNKNATDERLAFDVFEKGDAYVRTGDLLKFDEDYHLFFVDRLGDTFRWKSENVSTNEVEQAITEIGGVDVAVCVGVKVPQHEGRAGFAVVKPIDPHSPPDIKKLGKLLLERLPRYAVPLFIKFVDTVETTGNNKIQKKQFRDQKIPAPEGEVIYWLIGSEYKPLTLQDWARVESGHHKL